MLVGGGVPVHYNLPTEHHKRNMPDFGATVNKKKKTPNSEPVYLIHAMST